MEEFSADKSSHVEQASPQKNMNVHVDVCDASPADDSSFLLRHLSKFSHEDNASPATTSMPATHSPNSSDIGQELHMIVPIDDQQSASSTTSFLHAHFELWDKARALGNHIVVVVDPNQGHLVDDMNGLLEMLGQNLVVGIRWVIILSRSPPGSQSPQPSPVKDLRRWCITNSSTSLQFRLLEYSNVYGQGARDLLALIVQPFREQIISAGADAIRHSSPRATSASYFHSNFVEQQQGEDELVSREEAMREERARKSQDMEAQMREMMERDEAEAQQQQHAQHMQQRRQHAMMHAVPPSTQTLPPQVTRIGSRGSRGSRYSNSSATSTSTTRSHISQLVENMQTAEEEELRQHMQLGASYDDMEMEEDQDGYEDDDEGDDEFGEPFDRSSVSSKATVLTSNASHYSTDHAASQQRQIDDEPELHKIPQVQCQSWAFLLETLGCGAYLV